MKNQPQTIKRRWQDEGALMTVQQSGEEYFLENARTGEIVSPHMTLAQLQAWFKKNSAMEETQ